MPSPDAMTRLGFALGKMYRIERELGQGGMATVYVAEAVRPEAAGKFHAATRSLP